MVCRTCITIALLDLHMDTRPVSSCVKPATEKGVSCLFRACRVVHPPQFVVMAVDAKVTPTLTFRKGDSASTLRENASWQAQRKPGNEHEGKTSKDQYFALLAAGSEFNSQ